jgi:hypothetical protein
VLHATGLSYTTAGVLFSNVIFLAGLLAFYELGRRVLPEALARRATVYAAIFPIGFVFSMVYPEALVFGLIALAACLAIERRWFLAAVCAAGAALARPEGVFVALPIAATAWHSWRELRGSERGLALGAAAAGPVALASFPLYLGWALGNWHAWSLAQQQWGRTGFSASGFAKALTKPLAVSTWDPWIWRDIVFAGVYLILLVAAYRARAPRAWILAGAIMVVLPLGSGSFTSVSRFGLLALPVYWGLAWLGSTRPLDYALRGISLALLAAALFTLPVAFP